MIKLYPPVLENTIPASYIENGVVKITVPFSMNRAVSAHQVGGFELKIKTVQTGSYLYTIKTLNPSAYSITDQGCYVTFYLKDSELKLKVGQFYKVQLAYLNIDPVVKSEYYNNYITNKITLEEYEKSVLSSCTTGYYSTVATMKYSSKPKIYINDFKNTGINLYTYNYTGYYDQTNGDVTEKVYSYCFNIYDQNKTLILTSGENVHNSSNDTNADLSFDKYSVMFDLCYNVLYYIQYTITTINKITLSSPMYKMMQRETIDPEISANLIISQNFDNGYINISLEPKWDYYIKRAYNIQLISSNSGWLNTLSSIKEKGFSEEQALVIFHNKAKIRDPEFQQKTRSAKLCTGSFILSRASKDSAFSQWEELYRFKAYERIPEGTIFRDYTIEQGKIYQYSIQQYNDYGLYSKRLLSEQIVADFEDAFLYDGERQLKIRYNPKVQKFTNTVLEAKQDTIGSKYPFIFRNGHVDYHEFSISGLISYLSDDEFLFVDKYKLGIVDQPYRKSTEHKEQDIKEVNDSQNDLSKNITRERIFKMEVLDWLNNGKPKLFRSPTEGNYLVRLMKISLSPQDKLGRMLHTFNSTAYEIAECNNANLQHFGMVHTDEFDMEIFQQKTIDMKGKSPNVLLSLDIKTSDIINYLRFEDFLPGDIIHLIYKNQSRESIIIGNTGSLYLDNIPLELSQLYVEPRYQEIEITAQEHYDNRASYYTYQNGIYVQEDESKEFDRLETYYIISNTPLSSGMITYGYMTKLDNSFSRVKTVSFKEPIIRQFIGEHDILKEIEYINPDTKNPKIELMEFYYIKATKRPVDQIITDWVNEETLEDSNEFYYGTTVIENDKEINRSERFPLVELMYPIGLRPYEPNTYYVKNGNSYSLDTKGTFDVTQKYYLLGQYRQTQYPVGLVAYAPDLYYTIEDDSTKPGGKKYELSKGPWVKGQKYYIQSKSIKGKKTYHLVEYMTANTDYVFKPDKFYKWTGKKDEETGEPIYTLARTFEPELYDNHKTNEDVNYTSYSFIDETQNGAVNAYVTIDNDYVYNLKEYYLHVVNKETGKDEYQQCNALEYNINELKLAEGDTVEYDSEFDPNVLKYYKIKNILPHILHQVGTKWEQTDSHRSGYPDTIYKFQPKKYRDFYNNQNYKLTEYQPYIIINKEKIYVDDTIFFEVKNLKDKGTITELKSGNGITVEVVYTVKEYEYKVEDTLSIKNDYLSALNSYNEYMSYLTLDPSDENYVDAANIYGKFYHIYDDMVPQKIIQDTYKSLALAVAQLI